MNRLLLDSPEDHYAFLLPVMKTLLSQADKLIGGFLYQIPNMPSPQFNSMFHEEFQVRDKQTDRLESQSAFLFPLPLLPLAGGDAGQ